MHDAKPEEKTLRRREIWLNLVRILAIRLAVLSVVLLSASFLLPNYGGAFHAFVGLAFLMTVPYSLWIRDHVRLHEFAYLQFLGDLVVVTGLVYFTGGTGSALILLYPLVIVGAGIVTPGLRAMQIAVLAVLSYAVMAVLSIERVLVPYSGDIGGGVPVAQQVTVVAFHCLAFLLFGAVSMFLSRRCLYLGSRSQGHEMARWRTAASMASDMAHDVRNPVAAISGCAQVLDHMEKRSVRGDTRSMKTMMEERERLYRCIVDESARLDRIIEKYVSHAEFSEEKLRQLMRLAETNEGNAAPVLTNTPSAPVPAMAGDFSKI